MTGRSGRDPAEQTGPERAPRPTARAASLVERFGLLLTPFQSPDTPADPTAPDTPPPAEAQP